jgi:DNA helicase II / ATP-dependent DNA helicase PcrA
MRKKAKGLQATPLTLFDPEAIEVAPGPLGAGTPGSASHALQPGANFAALPQDPAHATAPVSHGAESRDLLLSLNDPQRRAVTTTRGPVLILAGPGSGKTRVITHRIAFLVQQQGVPPWQILATTFTTKAAGEMRERLVQMIGAQANELVVATFHSLCSRMLRSSKEYLLRFGLTPSFNIATESDQERILREVLKGRGMDLSGLEENQKSPGALRDLISQAKGGMQTPDLIEKQAEREDRYGLVVLARVYREYNRLLRKSSLMDFDDLLLYACHMLRSEDSVRAHYQRRWQYIHVDEFQDINLPQYVVMRLLAYGTDEHPGGHSNICVVGDDDQMIYTWRGASMENLERFERDFPGCVCILLEQNYRSSRTIVQASSQVVRGNPNRRAKNLWTSNAQGDPIVVVEAETEEDEASYVLGTIAQLYHAKQIGRWGDAAVLVRTNAQSQAFEEAALQMSIPYRVIGSTMFYQRKEVLDSLAYLRILANPDDEISLLRVINTPPRGIGKATVAALREWAAARALTLPEALGRLHEWTALERAPRRALSHFSQIMKALRQAVDGCSLPDLLDQVARLTGLEHALKDGGEEQQDRWENILELKRIASRFASVETAQALDLFLEHVALLSGADDERLGAKQEVGKGAETRDAVLLATLHVTKGMEFDTVFIAGMVENVLPHVRSTLETSAEGIAEELRLLYVGLTRAKARLYLTRAAQRVLYGRPVSTTPSRFLDALPPHLVQPLQL